MTWLVSRNSSSDRDPDIAARRMTVIFVEGESDRVFVCDPDLEGELVRALGIDAVEAVIAAEGELASFRRLQNQPAQRGRSVDAQLARFFGGRSGNKRRYARLLAEALPLDRVPLPLAEVIRAAQAASD